VLDGVPAGVVGGVVIAIDGRDPLGETECGFGDGMLYL
jgi:hypothetical protein